jgi:hypothetical protein
MRANAPLVGCCKYVGRGCLIAAASIVMATTPVNVGYAASTASGVATTQKAILYEEYPADQHGARYEGTVRWHAGPVAATPRQPKGFAILADVDIPARNLIMTLSIRRNMDASLPASHVGEVTFTLPSDFSDGGIASVKGFLMKTSEQAKALPLAAITARIRDNLFLIGMSNRDLERTQNILMLKENAWMDIAFVYKDQHRAIIALEKGKTGEHAFDEAFARWGQ